MGTEQHGGDDRQSSRCTRRCHYDHQGATAPVVSLAGGILLALTTVGATPAVETMALIFHPKR